ncbi:PREDICTED: solute carrier family 25 member 47 [Condylura cristata]|uniref:solute carrier family 25 member 47 n=1 Tax=Condylura cristata TaxID=143302 RepID=UPI000643792F|nr:PREDICTED: solute carrier family 25 member 47 [Condylura cristata]
MPVFKDWAERPALWRPPQWWHQTALRAAPSRQNLRASPTPTRPMDFIAGAIGGVCGVAVGYPLDTVKVRIQTEPKFTGIWHCIRDTYYRERLWGFYRGLSLPACTVPLVSSVSFGTYRHCLARICRFRYGLPTRWHWANPRVGGGTPCFTWGLFMPQGSPPSCHPSLGPSLPSSRPAWVSPADVMGVLMAGGCAGVLAWAVATPMDVVKSRLQADGRGPQRYRGLLHCLVSSVREEGPRVLFKGLALNCCRAFPVNMVVFVAYEAALRLTRAC